MEPAEYLEILSDNGALPAKRCAVYAAGSLIRGWGNSKSDLDIFVISPVPWEGSVASRELIWASPGLLPVQAFYVQDRRWDLEYWLDSQVDEIVSYLSWDRFEAGEASGSVLTDGEIGLIHRLGHCTVIEGHEWVKRRHQQFTDSAIRSVMASQALYEIDVYSEDAVGMLESGDTDSAVLAARHAMGFAVDAIVAINGEFERSPKWRAKRMKIVAPPEPTFQEYWDLETMSNFDPQDPQRWINDALVFCRRVAETIET